MRYVSVIEFSKETGIPLRLLREKCRTRKLPSICNGNRYYLDIDNKEEIAKMLTKEGDVLKRVRAIR